MALQELKRELKRYLKLGIIVTIPLLLILGTVYILNLVLPGIALIFIGSILAFIFIMFIGLVVDLLIRDVPL